MEKSTVPISFNIDSSDYTIPLKLTVLLDGVEIYNNQISQKVEFSSSISEEGAEHELQLVMSGKTADHTKIDEQGNILKDAMLSCCDFYVDGIDISKLFFAMATYSHNFNGNGNQVEEKFYGNLGCNGSVSFKFTTPFYLWLLENM